MKKGGAQAFWDFFFEKQPDLKPHKNLPAVKTDLLHLDRNEDFLIWFGHSSYLLQNGGKRFLVDPVLANRFPPSLMFQPFKGTDLYKPEHIVEMDWNDSYRIDNDYQIHCLPARHFSNRLFKNTQTL